jgi:hypothetical protein
LSSTASREEGEITLKKLRITDRVSFVALDADGAKAVKISDSALGSTPHLLVRIAATHAGIVTANNTFYLPDKMRKSTPTWTAQYNKPVLTHHNREQDAIGRIVGAKYVDMASNMPMSVQNKICRDSHLVNDNLKRFVEGTLSPKAEIQFIRDLLVNTGVLNDKNYQGLGYSEIIAAITDPDAIQKVKDGRYLTGSISGSTDQAMCSVCETDWIKDDRCDHTPGEVYDGKKAFLIAGEFEYEEYSFVNAPADVHSRTLEMVADGKAEKINIAITEKTQNMADQETDKQTSVVQDSTAEVVPATTDTTVVDEANEPLTSVSAKTTEELEQLFNTTDIAAESVTDEQSDAIYELMAREVDGEKSVLADAKLSTKKRKGLASSTFCGPGRSFPVPDCAHVTAARRLIGRYKGPGDKTAILACVDRKAKALGCDGASDSVTEPATESATAVTTNVADCKECETKIKNALAATAQELSDLKTQHAALRLELKDLYRDLGTMEDQVVKAKAESRLLKAARLVDFESLEKASKGGGKLSKVEAAALVSDIVAKLGDDALDSRFKAVDMSNIIDKLDSGLANSNPQGTIANPSAISDDKSQTTDSDSTSTSQWSKEIQDTHKYLLEDRGALAAARYLERMRREGYIK